MKISTFVMGVMGMMAVVGCGRIDPSLFNGQGSDASVMQGPAPVEGQACAAGSRPVPGCNPACQGTFWTCQDSLWMCVHSNGCAALPPPVDAGAAVDSSAPADAAMRPTTDASVIPTDTASAVDAAVAVDRPAAADVMTAPVDAGAPADVAVVADAGTGVAACNGSNLGQVCYNGTGTCRNPGTCERFSSGEIRCNASLVIPGVEACDGLDNNCNGLVDDLGARVCYTGAMGTLGVGRCRAGNQACRGGSWATCEGEVTPAAVELCGNGIDDNCNGTTDEGCGPCAGLTPAVGSTCSVGMGTCRASGTWICIGGTTLGCSATPGVAHTEVCADGLDNNCNGATDEPGCVPSDTGPRETTRSITIEQSTDFRALCTVGWTLVAFTPPAWEPAALPALLPDGLTGVIYATGRCGPTDWRTDFWERNNGRRADELGLLVRVGTRVVTTRVFVRPQMIGSGSTARTVYQLAIPVD